MSWWAAWGGFLLLLCWGVGACGRLRRLRAHLELTFAALEDPLQQQLAWARGCLPPPQDAACAPWTPRADAEAGVWQRLHSASARLAQSLASARGHLLAPAAMAELMAAQRALNQAWQQVYAGGRGHDGAALSATLQLQHEQLQTQVLPHCAAFNDAAQAYNEAIGQFPALLLACGLGFRRVGVLQPLAWRPEAG